MKRRDISKERVSQGGGIDGFDTKEATEINRARMAHLESLRLEIEEKSVLDIGCGVGRLAQFFVENRCKITCVDLRQENVLALRSRYPDLEAHVLDVEKSSLSSLGSFDIVFAYGLLYHLENPLAGLRNMESVCKEMMLLETVVIDSALPLVQLVDEPPALNQAFRGLGCRPSPSFVAMALPCR